MRSASPRAARIRRERAATVKRTTHGPERCQFPGGCTDEAVDWDERLTRARGGSATDRDNALLLCRRHHDRKHQHPADAQALGIMPSAEPINRANMSDMPTAQADQLDERVTLRVKTSGAEHVRQLAAKHGVRPAVVWRAMFRVAARHPADVDAEIGRTHGGDDV